MDKMEYEKPELKELDTGHGQQCMNGSSAPGETCLSGGSAAQCTIGSAVGGPQ